MFCLLFEHVVGSKKLNVEYCYHLTFIYFGFKKIMLISKY